MFRHILFPVDFSTQSIDAIRPVRDWAARLGAKVSLLHVLETGNSIDWYSYLALADVESIRNDARRRLKDLAASGFDGVPHLAELKEGDAARSIIQYARDNAVDLIMMPTTGQGRLRRLLIGSVTAKVLYDADCPVWTDAHAPDELQPASADAPVMCAVDGTGHSAEVIRTAARIAEAAKAPLELVHVVPSPWLDGEAQPGAKEALEASWIAEARQKIEGIQARLGTKANVRFVFGELAKALGEEARRSQARLLVIGRGHMHAALGRLRTHVNAIIERSPCPVLSV